MVEDKEGVQEEQAAEEKKVPQDTVLVVDKGYIDPKSIFQRIDNYIKDGGK